MHPPRGSRPALPRLASRLAAALALAAALLLPAASPAMAAGVTISAEPLLAGHVRPGAWAGVRVHLENDGPLVDGELRISGSQQGRSTFGVAVQLATGASQDHILYGQPGFFGGRFVITLVSGGATVATQDVSVTAHDAYTPTTFIVAERPEGILADIRRGATVPQSNAPVVVSIGTDDLPERIEAWAAVDRLVWQDVDSSRLSREQLTALRTWVSAGGRLTIVGGTTATTTLGAFPAEILPFTPDRTVDASPTDLAALLGTLPVGASALPAIAGTLTRGTVLARSGDHVIAAATGYGQGTVTVLGFDPGAAWLAGTDTAEALWRRLQPVNESGQAVNPLAIQDDSILLGALNNLPAVELPSIDQLFLLLLGYIALIGPINYLVLRRLDRRELAWITMPVLVAVFAVGAYGLGISLKGTDVVVNELAIVRGAAGTDVGVGQVYVGIFSPTRATYDVGVRGNALLSNPVTLQSQGNTEQPIDVLTGDPSRLRGYQVGFGVLRGFRAEASVATPRVDSDLRLVGSRLQGTVTNRSEMELQQVAVVYGSTAQLLADMAPGESRPVDLDLAGGNAFSIPLSERLFGTATPRDPVATRTLYTRRTIIDQLSGYSGKIAGSVTNDSPVIIAWRPEGTLDVDLGVATHKVGETLYLLPARAAIGGATVFTGDLVRHALLESDAVEAFDEGSGYQLSRGTIVAEYRPIAFSGRFEIERLLLSIMQGEIRSLSADGRDLAPLPASEQPDQDDPLGEEPAAGDPGGGGGNGVGGKPPDRGFFEGLPELQLFDREAGLWVEFEDPENGVTYLIADPSRFVDEAGAFRARFVNRHGDGEYAYFTLLVRMEGTVG